MSYYRTILLNMPERRERDECCVLVERTEPLLLRVLSLVAEGPKDMPLLLATLPPLVGPNNDARCGLECIS